MPCGLATSTSSSFSKQITKNLHNCTEICTRIDIAALFVIVRHWEQPNTHCCRRGYINYGYVHKMNCYAGAVNMSEVVLSGGKVCPNVLLNEKNKL